MDVSDELDPELIAEMAIALGRDRGYASFYQWYDRQVMERGIVSDLLRFAPEEFPSLPLEVHSLEQDPPDCVVTFPNARFGVEVTELVDQSFLESVVRVKRAGEVVYDWAAWDAEKFSHHLQGRVDAKAGPAEIMGGPYDEYLLLVHTAESGLRPADVSRWLREHPVRVSGVISRAYLMFDYHPSDDTRVLKFGDCGPSGRAA